MVAKALCNCLGRLLAPLLDAADPDLVAQSVWHASSAGVCCAACQGLSCTVDQDHAQQTQALLCHAGAKAMPMYSRRCN